MEIVGDFFEARSEGKQSSAKYYGRHSRRDNVQKAENARCSKYFSVGKVKVNNNNKRGMQLPAREELNNDP